MFVCTCNAGFTGPVCDPVTSAPTATPAADSNNNAAASDGSGDISTSGYLLWVIVAAGVVALLVIVLVVIRCKRNNNTYVIDNDFKRGPIDGDGDDDGIGGGGRLASSARTNRASYNNPVFSPVMGAPGQEPVGASSYPPSTAKSTGYAAHSTLDDDSDPLPNFDDASVA